MIRSVLNLSKLHCFMVALSLLSLPAIVCAQNNPDKNGGASEKQSLVSLKKQTDKKIFNLEGTLEIRAALYTDRKKEETLEYVLITPDQQYYYLHFADKIPSELKTGAYIKIKTAAFFSADEHQLYLASDEIIILKEASISPDAFGSQRTMVFLVNFQNQPSNQPFPTSSVYNTIFNVVSGQYVEQSYNQTNLVGNVIGWFTLGINSNTTCDAITNNIPPLAEQAAAQRGVDLNGYIHRVYIFPNTSSCSWAGLGTVGRGGAYSNAWINGYNDLRVIAHEIGHNMSLFHSHRLTCQGGGSRGSCTSDNYGDYADTMGWGNGTHFNAYQKERLGWLNYSRSPLIITVNRAATYTIQPLSTYGNNTNIKALKILKQNLPDGSQDYYYVEFRQPYGYDVSLGSCGSYCNFTQGVLLHVGNSRDGNTSNIFYPNGNISNPRFIALLPGQSFRDPLAANGGISITNNWINSSGATVTVNFGVR